jgi:hypothetical protein
MQCTCVCVCVAGTRLGHFQEKEVYVLLLPAESVRLHQDRQVDYRKHSAIKAEVRPGVQAHNLQVAVP